MSRMTSAQVIELGHYLDPDFDASSLTIPQLLGVLGFHNISYPSPYTKAKLVQVFNEHIKAKAETLQKERLIRRNTDPSDDGITDGVTGELLGQKPLVAPRRSSRLSRAPTEEPPVQLDPPKPKKRRSSAQPSLGGPSRKSTSKKPAAPILVEESESEEEPEPVPVKRVEKKKTDEPGAKARRISGPDSGWEDNNIFQMGSPSPVKSAPKIRKSTPRRKSTSAPPDSPFAAPVMSPASPPQVKQFEPQLPADLMEEFKKVSPSPFKATPQKSPRYQDTDNPFRATPKRERYSAEYEDFEASLKGGPDEEDDDGFFGDAEVSGLDDSLIALDKPTEPEDKESTDEETEEDPSVAISRRIARGDPSALIVRPIPPQQGPSLPLSIRLLIIAFTIFAGFASYRWKTESTPLGYCERGTNTNIMVQKWKAQLEAIESCNRENRTTLYLPSAENFDVKVSCPEEYIIDKHPMSCTPCPDHATCGLYSLKCDNGYLLRPHPAFFWTEPLADREHISLSTSSSPAFLGGALISYLDGLPGLGSVAFPPSCVEDPKRKRNIGVLGKAMETYLAQERGRILCAGKFSPASDSEGGEAKTWGIAINELKSVMQQKTPSHLLPTFDDTFNEAVQQLIQWGGVVIGEDASGKRYLARTIPDLTWTCALTVKSRETWAEWRTSVIGFFVLLGTLYYTRYRLAQRRATTKRVAELVQIALDALRHQELAHHTDPVTAPYAYLSSLQLRDLILQEEHSIPARRKVWEQVENIVEGNANVRVNLEEVEGGDELRVWRWVGSSRRPTKISYEEREAQLETPSKTRS